LNWCHFFGYKLLVDHRPDFGGGQMDGVKPGLMDCLVQSNLGSKLLVGHRAGFGEWADG
jgi:hypothetical protein